MTPHLDSRPGLRGERKTGGQSQGGTTGLAAEVPSFGLRTGSVLRLWAGLSEDGNQVVSGVKGAGTQRWEAGGARLSIPVILSGYEILISPENLLQG